MANKDSVKDSDIVINAEREDGTKFSVSAQSFGLNDYAGCDVTGHKYYVGKAIKLGANKAK